MKLAILAIACLGLAAAFPHHNRGVPSGDINKLLDDALTYYLDEYKKAPQHPFKFETIPIKTESLDLTVDITNVKQNLGDSISKSHSSSISDSSLSVSLAFAAGLSTTGDVAVKGTIKGLPVDKTGSVLLSWNSISEKVQLNAAHDAKSVTIKDLSVDIKADEPAVQFSNLDIDLEDEVGKGVQEGISRVMKSLEKTVKEGMPTTISYLNSLLKNYNLEQLYEILRAKVPVQTHFRPLFYLM